MTEGRERELKYRILSQEGFFCLRDSPEWGTRGDVEDQSNYYFDTPDHRLLASRVILRVRQSGGMGAGALQPCVLTLKCGRDVRPGFFDSVELEQEIDEEVLLRSLRNPAAILEVCSPAVEELRRRFGALSLIVAGHLKNERVRRDPGTGFTLEVDRILFPDGRESYELEIETAEIPRAEAWIRESLLGKGLPLEPQTLTKYEQLLRWSRGGEREVRDGTSPPGSRR